jgi:hypothetical protein
LNLFVQEIFNIIFLKNRNLLIPIHKGAKSPTIVGVAAFDNMMPVAHIVISIDKNNPTKVAIRIPLGKKHGS